MADSSAQRAAPRAAELDAAIDAAVRAGTAIMEVYARDFSVAEKADRSPLTEADTRAHAAIHATLSARTPEIPILSEEGADVAVAVRQSWGRYWLVDPLDGTKEFVSRNDEFTVNIALMARTEGEPPSGDAPGTPDAARAPGALPAIPIAGVVLAPATGRLYVGVTGRGAWSYRAGGGEGERGAVGGPTFREIEKHGTPLPSVAEFADRPYTIVASRSHLSPATTAYIEARRVEHPTLEVATAGSSLKICRVAEGSADEYPRFGPTMEWDTAAGDAIARAAGCQVLVWDRAPGGTTERPDSTAGPLRYNKTDLHNPWFLVRRR